MNDTHDGTATITPAAPRANAEAARQQLLHDGADPYDVPVGAETLGWVLTCLRTTTDLGPDTIGWLTYGLRASWQLADPGAEQDTRAALTKALHRPGAAVELPARPHGSDPDEAAAATVTARLAMARILHEQGRCVLAHREAAAVLRQVAARDGGWPPGSWSCPDRPLLSAMRMLVLCGRHRDAQNLADTYAQLLPRPGASGWASSARTAYRGLYQRQEFDRHWPVCTRKHPARDHAIRRFAARPALSGYLQTLLHGKTQQAGGAVRSPGRAALADALIHEYMANDPSQPSLARRTGYAKSNLQLLLAGQQIRRERPIRARPATEVEMFDARLLINRPRPLSLLFIGDQDRTDPQLFDQFVATPAAQLDHRIAGRWYRHVPGLRYDPAPSYRHGYLCTQAMTVMLPAAGTPADAVRARARELVQYGCLPLAAAGHGLDDLLPPLLIMRDSDHVVVTLLWLNAIAGTSQHRDLLTAIHLRLNPATEPTGPAATGPAIRP